MGERPFRLKQRLRPLHDQPHGLVPAGLHQLVTTPDQRRSEPVAQLALPAEEALGSQPTAADPGPAPVPARRPCVHRDGDVDAAAVAAEQAGGRHPAVDVFLARALQQMGVDTLRPRLPHGIRRGGSLDVRDAVVCHRPPPHRSCHRSSGRQPGAREGGRPAPPALPTGSARGCHASPSSRSPAMAGDVGGFSGLSSSVGRATRFCPVLASKICILLVSYQSSTSSRPSLTREAASRRAVIEMPSPWRS